MTSTDAKNLVEGLILQHIHLAPNEFVQSKRTNNMTLNLTSVSTAATAIVDALSTLAPTENLPPPPRLT